jgi:hypothetical protein
MMLPEPEFVVPQPLTEILPLHTFATTVRVSDEDKCYCRLRPKDLTLLYADNDDLRVSHHQPNC